MTKDNAFIFNYLKNLFPEFVCELNYRSAYELLISVILSAQCTDKRVNLTTPALFKIANTPQQMVKLPVEELEKLIYSTGFYRNKAKNILKMSQSLINEYGGEVPSDWVELQKLAGVGRKTANVVYSVAFGGAAIAVDTHVFRVSNRLGIATGKKELQVELGLMEQFDKSVWSELHYMLVLFGRYYCKAKKPECDSCGLKQNCKYYNEVVRKEDWYVYR